jgi:hypothetical protein
MGIARTPVTDETPNPPAPEPAAEPDDPAAEPAEPAPEPALPEAAPPSPGRRASWADTRPRRPDYRGEELDPERGPGLGCFWFQVIVLGFFIVLIPIGLKLNWPFELLAFLLFVVIGLLLLTGQSVIFLLRLVAADRRSQGRRRPLASPTKTVGALEDEQEVAAAVGGEVPPATAEPADVEPAAEADPGADVPDPAATPDADERAPAPGVGPDEAPPEEPGAGVRQ